MHVSRQSGTASASRSAAQLLVQVAAPSLQSVVTHQPSASASVQLVVQCALPSLQSPQVSVTCGSHDVHATNPSPSASAHGTPIVIVIGVVPISDHHAVTTYCAPTVRPV